MKLGFAGTPEAAVPSLEALVASHHEVDMVLTRPDAPAGRGRAGRRSAVGNRADHLDVPVYQPAHLRDEQTLEPLAQAQLDLVVVVAYGLILPPPALAVPRLGWINLHFSLLPAWRGAAPVQRALMAGDQVTGACTFQIVAGLDAGPIFGQLTEPIGPRDTAGDLLARLAVAGARLVVDTCDAIESGIARPVPQAREGISHAPRLTTADAHVPWASPAFHVDRVIRACTPKPGAWTMAAGRRLKVGPVEPTGSPVPGAAQPSQAASLPALGPGEVYAERSGVYVGTGTAPVRLGEVAPEGKTWMDAAAWWRGARLQPGLILGEHGLGEQA